jgi:hypothetical protein
VIGAGSIISEKYSFTRIADFIYSDCESLIFGIHNPRPPCEPARQSPEGEADGGRARRGGRAQSEIRIPFSLLVFVFVPVVGIWPVGMRMSDGSMFVPVTVVNGPRHPGKHVIVMPVIMPMPVLMCSGFMTMQMSVSFEEKESQGYDDEDSGNYLGQGDRFAKESCGHDDPKEWRTGEDDLTSSGTKFLRRSDV